MTQRYVINLASRPDRLATFRRLNPHIGARPFPAVPGSLELRSANPAVFDPGLAYTAARIGNTLSHVRLWEMCAEADEPFLILEDDAVLSRGRHDWTAPGCPLMYWGWNFNLPCIVDIGVSPVTIAGSQRSVRLFLEDDAPSVPRWQVFNLLLAFGTFAYTLTPEGAAYLLERALPIQSFTMTMPELPDHTVTNEGIDCVLNALHRDLGTGVAFPPLALTPNQ